MISFVAEILGKLIEIIYELTGNNYGISIIIFTILTKLLLLPLNIQQVKSTEKINKIKPQYDKIMEKYKNNKEKQAEEITKLYAENKISPMGGCLTAIIQIPLVLAMFYIVRQPLTYVLNFSQDDIRIYTAEMLDIYDISTVTKNQIASSEIQIAREYNLIDMDFLGINLGDIPANVFSKDENKKAPIIALIVPIMSFLISLYQTRRAKQNNDNMSEEQQEMQKSMNLMMPLLSASVSYSMPLALGIYWLLGSLFSVLQQKILKMIVKKDKDINNNEKHLLLDSKKGGNNNE